MNRETAAGILKLAAIPVIFSGLVWLSIVFLQLQNLNSMFNGISGQMEMFGQLESMMMSSFGRYSYAAPVVVMVWGGIQ